MNQKKNRGGGEEDLISLREKDLLVQLDLSGTTKAGVRVKVSP